MVQGLKPRGPEIPANLPNLAAARYYFSKNIVDGMKNRSTECFSSGDVFFFQSVPEVLARSNLVVGLTLPVDSAGGMKEEGCTNSDSEGEKRVSWAA